MYSKFDNIVQASEKEIVKCLVTSDDIFYTLISPNSICQVEHMKFVLNEYSRMSQGAPKKIIVELGQYSTINLEARELLQSHNTDGVCEAIVVTNNAQLLLVKFYHKNKKHQNPSKHFHTLENAIAWTNTFC